MANLLYNLAQPFSNTKQYTQGTIVVYNDRMYEMTASDYTPGAFNPEKFTERFLSEMISGKLNSNLVGKLLNVELTIACNYGRDDLDTMIPCELYNKIKIRSRATTCTYTLKDPNHNAIASTNSTSYGDEIDISAYDYVLFNNDKTNNPGYVMFTG